MGEFYKLIVANKIMFPPVCNKWRLNDNLKGSLDNLMFTLYNCAVNEVLVMPNEYLRESEHLKFYDQRKKLEIYELQVRPILELAFQPYDSDPWDIDPEDRLAFIWDELTEFYTNLLFCSKLRIPFVFDIYGLTKNLMKIRDDLVRKRLLNNPKILNDLLAIIWLYQRQEGWSVVPINSVNMDIMDIWKRLQKSSQYQILLQETCKIGFIPSNSVKNHLLRLKDLSDDIAENKAFSKLVLTTKTAINLYLGPLGSLSTEVGTHFASLVFNKLYIPPIFDLNAIEEAFDRVYYPDKDER